MRSPTRRHGRQPVRHGRPKAVHLWHWKGGLTFLPSFVSLQRLSAASAVGVSEQRKRETETETKKDIDKRPTENNPNQHLQQHGSAKSGTPQRRPRAVCHQPPRNRSSGRRFSSTVTGGLRAVPSATATTPAVLSLHTPAAHRTKPRQRRAGALSGPTDGVGGRGGLAVSQLELGI